MKNIPSESIGFRIKNLRKTADLTQQQLAVKVGVSKIAIGTWERNIHPPKGPNLALLAKALQTTSDYLSIGTPAPGVKVRHHQYMTLPVVTWTDAKEAPSVKLRTAMAWRATALLVGDNAYFLQMRDESMHNPTGTPCIPKNAYVLVDPDIPFNTNDIVVAFLPDQDDALIKMLIIDGPHRYLKSLNPEYKTIELPMNALVLGVVRQVTQDL